MLGQHAKKSRLRNVICRFPSRQCAKLPYQRKHFYIVFFCYNPSHPVVTEGFVQSLFYII